jgi:lipid II isoglutaminyl synthase (glutamine-hydrolysing)
MYTLNICHLYPDLLNLYGDRGNIISLAKRCEWRGIEVNLTQLSMNQNYAPEDYDIVFLGGGQDYEQEIIQEDFLFQKGTEIKNAVSYNKVFLCICGGYQLMGNYYKTWDGKEIEFLGAIDVYTVAAKDRMIGNFIFQCDFLKTDTFDGNMVGFENHSGRTFLGPSTKPLGKVIVGGGNNGEDGFEGAIFNQVYCSYSHGSLLPKNPALSDHLISTALKQKYTDFESLEILENVLEDSGRLEMQKLLIK